jgi:hypothetical protein
MCKEYGIIREQGEYMDPVPLKPEENAIINERTDEAESNE